MAYVSCGFQRFGPEPPLRRPLYQQLIIHDSDELIRIPWACCWLESSTDMSRTVSNSLQVPAYNKNYKKKQMTIWQIHTQSYKYIQIHNQHNHNPKFCILWKKKTSTSKSHPIHRHPHPNVPPVLWVDFSGRLVDTAWIPGGKQQGRSDRGCWVDRVPNIKCWTSTTTQSLAQSSASSHVSLYFLKKKLPLETISISINKILRLSVHLPSSTPPGSFGMLILGLINCVLRAVRVAAKWNCNSRRKCEGINICRTESQA